LCPDVQLRPPCIPHGFAAGRRQGSLEEVLVEPDADELRMAGLLLAEEVACTPLVKVPGS
jgi:hypothetical protein